MSWISFHKHDRANWIYVIMHEEIVSSWNIFHTSGNSFVQCGFLHEQLHISSWLCHVCGMKLKTSGDTSKKAINLESPLSLSLPRNFEDHDSGYPLRVHTTATWDQFWNIIKKFWKYWDGVFLISLWLIESKNQVLNITHHISPNTHHILHRSL